MPSCIGQQHYLKAHTAHIRVLCLSDIAMKTEIMGADLRDIVEANYSCYWEIVESGAADSVNMLCVKWRVQVPCSKFVGEFCKMEIELK